MKNEIGSFYESVPMTGDRNDADTVFDLLGRIPGFTPYFFSCGRQPIGAVADDIEANLHGPKTCMLPSYTCDTVIIPFTDRGWDVTFYGVNTDLTVDDAFISLCESVKPSVLLMHTYYGCDTIANVRDRIGKWQKERGLIFIEDMTQSLFLLDDIAPTADYYVGSLRKWFPIPDGGFALSSTPLDVAYNGEYTEYIETKTSAQKMKYDYLTGVRDEKDEVLRLNRRSEDLLYEEDRFHDMSKISYDMLKITDIGSIASKRNRNAAVLIDGIDRLRDIRSLIHIDTEAPLYVPVITSDRDKLQKHLREYDIFAPVLWPVPKECEDTMSDDVRTVFNDMLASPCDQRYDEEDMHRILSCLESYDNGVR